MSNLKTLSISARSSHLARLQAEMVGQAITEKFPAIQINYHFRESLGDKNLHDPLWKMPDKGVFTEDFYQDLVEGKTDMVVHSWKDLPVLDKTDTMIAATLSRADQRDLLIFKKASFEKLKQKNLPIHIFTSSPRREYNLKPLFTQILPYQPQTVEFKNIRGNVPTRLRKFLEAQDVDGLVLAKAAVDRFTQSQWSEVQEVKEFILSTLQSELWMVLPLTENPNAAAQGALAIEVKSTHHEVLNILKEIHDQHTFEAAHIERRVLKSFGGGCHQKIGVTVLKRSGQSYFFLKGLTDRGVVLNQKKSVENLNLENYQEVLNYLSPEAHSQLKQNIWSSSSLSQYFDVVDLKSKLNPDLSSQSLALYVSKSSALTESVLSQMKLNKTYLWSSGLSTWKSIAQKGLWCCGSSEGLGDKEDLRVAHYDQSMSWVKLTHREAQKSSNYQTVASYELKPKFELLNANIKSLLNEMKKSEVIYWSSFFHFKVLKSIVESQAQKTEQSEIQKLWVEILNQKSHQSGPGLTFKNLKEFIPCLTIKI